MIKILAILTIAAFAAFFVPNAQAMVCFDKDGYERFKNQFRESEIAKGSVGNGDELKMRLLSNKDTGTWTMIIVRKDGLMCPFSSGNNLKLIAPLIKGREI